MKLDSPIKTLGYVQLYNELKQALLGLPSDAWYSDTSRQEIFSKVHGSTRTLLLLFCDGWPALDVEYRSAWPLLSQYAEPLMRDIIEQHYGFGGAILRAMVARLPPGAKINRHYDAHPSFAVAHRIHVPLQTHPDVKVTVRDDTFFLEEGIAYEISNLDYHSVANNSTCDRLHFIFDYAPGNSFVKG